MLKKEDCIAIAAQYRSRRSFKKQSESAYETAQNNGWLDECCSHMTELGRHRKWTKELCFEVAQEYRSRTDFQKEASKAYQAAYVHGWLDECCAHMGRPTKKTKERCIVLAQQYGTRIGFKKAEPSAYKVACSNGWLDECCSHMNRSVKWTKDACINEAKRYGARSDFWISSRGAYDAARRNGWLAECCLHMSGQARPRKWTKERCITVAKEYETRSGFQKGMFSAYKAALAKGWLDECCVHMGAPVRSKKWTKEACLLLSQHYETRSSFQNGSGGAYEAARTNGWLDKCCAHMVPAARPRKWTKEKCMAVATEYETRTSFQKSVSGAYNAAKVNGWLDECCAHMLSVSSKWTKEKCMSVALQHTSRWSFSSGENGAYQVARVNGWLDECCAHMEAAFQWSKELCLAEALKHQTRSSFVKFASGAYHAAQRNNWLNECCRHMERVTKWTKVACIDEARKYGTVSAFRAAARGAYDSAKKYGWLDECCGHMRTAETNIVGGGGSDASNQPRKKWTKENCIEAARSFTTRSDYLNNCGSAYMAAYKHGWLAECCAHMSSPVKRSEVTKEECLAAAKQYKYRSEFAGEDQSLYAKARKNGWLDECCKHMEQKAVEHRPVRKWTLEAVVSAAKLAGTKRNFRQHFVAAYSAALTYGWLNDCNQFLVGESSTKQNSAKSGGRQGE